MYLIHIKVSKRHATQYVEYFVLILVNYLSIYGKILNMRVHNQFMAKRYICSWQNIQKTVLIKSRGGRGRAKWRGINLFLTKKPLCYPHFHWKYKRATQKRWRGKDNIKKTRKKHDEDDDDACGE